MNKIIRAIFTNRLGNTLAIINFVMIALNRSGVTNILFRDGLAFPVFIANLPARIVSVMVSLVLFGDPRYGRSVVESYSLQDLGFVYLQWVMIGAAATSIAAVITRRRIEKLEMKGLLRLQSFRIEAEPVNFTPSSSSTSRA